MFGAVSEITCCVDIFAAGSDTDSNLGLSISGTEHRSIDADACFGDPLSAIHSPGVRIRLARNVSHLAVRHSSAAY